MRLGRNMNVIIHSTDVLVCSGICGDMLFQLYKDFENNFFATCNGKPFDLQRVYTAKPGELNIGGGTVDKKVYILEGRSSELTVSVLQVPNNYLNVGFGKKILMLDQNTVQVWDMRNNVYTYKRTGPFLDFVFHHAVENDSYGSR